MMARTLRWEVYAVMVGCMWGELGARDA